MEHGRTQSGPESREQTDSTQDPSRPTAKAAILKIELLGGFGLALGGRPIALTTRKAKALIGHLALSARQSETRERLVGLLWSETEETKARASLRQALRTLRDTLEAEGFWGFSTYRTDIALEPGTVETDVAEVITSAQNGAPVERLVETPRIAETLLAGLDDVDPAFHSWLLVQREGLRQKLARALEAHLDHAALPKERRVRCARALIETDPTHEIAYQHVMRASAEAGDIAGALSAYRRLWNVLDEDFDMEPSDSTQALVARIKSAPESFRRNEEPPAPRQAAPADLPALGSVAGATDRRLVLVVGAFEAASDKRLVSGFRFELIRRLVRFREWSIIDRTALGADAPLPVSAYLVSGRVFQAPGDLTVVVELKEQGTGAVVWSEAYRIALEDFFGALQSVVRRIATTLNVYVSVERLRRIATAPDVPLEIYDDWQRGQMLVLVLHPDMHRQAAAIFEAVIAKAPEFGPAHSSLAQLENAHHIVFAGRYRTPDRLERAAMLAARACALDPLDSRAQLCLAWSHAMNARFELAEAHFRLACDLNENDPWTITSTALGLAFADRPREALALADRIVDLIVVSAPLHWGYQCQIRLVCGDLEGSVRAGERAGGESPYLSGWRAAALGLIGEEAHAREEGMRFLARVRGTWFGDPDPSDLAIGHWFTRSFPVRNAATLEQLRVGLGRAGVPTVHAAR